MTIDSRSGEPHSSPTPNELHVDFKCDFKKTKNKWTSKRVGRQLSIMEPRINPAPAPSRYRGIEVESSAHYPTAQQVRSPFLFTTRGAVVIGNHEGEKVTRHLLEGIKTANDLVLWIPDLAQ